MRRFTNSIEGSLQSQNWYGALTLALTLPDICGWLENSALFPKERYVTWFDKWLLDKYTGYIGPDRIKHIFLYGEDCYALRCSYLHRGGDDISDQRAKKALDNFHFIMPPSYGIVHENQSNNTLQLQVDIFCRDIIEAVEAWNVSVKSNKEIQDKMASLLIIHDSTNGVRF